MLEILSIVVLALLAYYIAFPLRFKYYLGLALVFFGRCPRCKNKITYIKNYWVCPTCNKRG